MSLSKPAFEIEYESYMDDRSKQQYSGHEEILTLSTATHKLIFAFTEEMLMTDEVVPRNSAPLVRRSTNALVMKNAADMLLLKTCPQISGVSWSRGSPFSTKLFTFFS